MAYVENIDGGVTEVTLGQTIHFKSDIEQCGKVIKIDGDDITIYRRSGFEGDYIGGQTQVVEHAGDCWIEGEW